MTSATPANVPPKLTLRKLASRQELRRFQCGVPEIDRWARDKAYKYSVRGRASVSVAFTSGNAAACGFYSLTHSIAETSKLLRGEDRDLWDNAPIVYIGYLAVAQAMQNSGIGGMMLIDALSKAYRIHQIVPLYGVGLRALNADSQRLYGRHGFRVAPKEDTNTPLMILPIWTVEDLFKPR